MLGHEEHEIGDSGKEWLNRLHPEDLERAQGEMRRHIAGETPMYMCEQRLRCKDGSYKWILDRGLVIRRDITGKPVRIVGIHTDISKRKEAEAALRDSEARFRSYVEESPIAIMVCDREGRYVDVNPAAQQLIGYPRTELLGRHIASLLIETSHQQALADFQNLLKQGHIDCEYQMRHREGHYLWVQLRAARIGPDRFLGYHIDITARKAAEELVRLQGLVMEAAANAMVIANHEGRIEWVNAAFCHITGYGREEALGRRPADLVKSGRQDQAFYESMWDHLGHGKVWRGEIVNRHKDGHLYTEEMTITPILDGHGTITHYVAIKQDISARKSLEAQLLRTQRLESVGRLASGIAHDLNNILAPVLLAPTVVRGMVRDPTVDNIMESVEKNAQRGADIVRQLLTFGRGMEAKRVALPMRPLILDLLKLITETFPRDIEIQHELHGQPLLVEGDQTQLHQLLMNLCINARDAMPNGGRLSIGLKQEDVPESKSEVYAWVTAGPHAVLTVRDTGTGIEADHLDKIFDPFFTTKPPSQGTGLGLSTAIGIVRGHRGFMEVQSRPGQGATFLVYLPLAASTVPPMKKREARDPLIQGNGETILLVDDEDGIRRVLGEILRRNGYQVILASHGQEAMDVLQTKAGSINLVLTDLMMPVMDGWALIHEVRNQWPGRPIVAMSGNLPHADWIAQIHPLVNDLLVKPCQAARLLTCLQDVLDNAKS